MSYRVEWYPMDRAPKDGREILVFIREVRERFVVYWCSRDLCWVYARTPKVTGKEITIMCHPDLWTDLPELPE